jgi:hypothetical protein
MGLAARDGIAARSATIVGMGESFILKCNGASSVAE